MLKQYNLWWMQVYRQKFTSQQPMLNTTSSETCQGYENIELWALLRQMKTSMWFLLWTYCSTMNQPSNSITVSSCKYHTRIKQRMNTFFANPFAWHLTSITMPTATHTSDHCPHVLSLHYLSLQWSAWRLATGIFRRYARRKSLMQWQCIMLGLVLLSSLPPYVQFTLSH